MVSSKPQKQGVRQNILLKTNTIIVMINFEALFNLTYGLYLVSAGSREKGNGYISNTVFQVTAEPPQFATCCNKNNYTTDLIQQYGSFAVSVLNNDTSQDLISTFGYKSGRDTNKMSAAKVIYGETGVPIVLDDCIAYLEIKVKQTIDAGTHLIFIGELIQAEQVDAGKEPLTYANYRKIRKAAAPKNAPTYIDKSKLESDKPKVEILKKYECADCGYVYDEAEEKEKFADLPDDWVCPLCGAAKREFFEIK